MRIWLFEQFEKELSAVNAAVINDAYNMLKTPNTRVKYLVRLLFGNASDRAIG